MLSINVHRIIIRKTIHKIAFLGSGATLHQMVVTGVGTYGERMERETITGVRAPGEGQGAKPPEAERFWQNNVKICT